MENKEIKKLYDEVKLDFEVRDFLALDRTVLANERTFLAYIRTFMGLVASGVGLMLIFETSIFMVFGIVCIVAGFFALAFGLRRFFLVRRKIFLAYKTGKVDDKIL